MVLRYFVPDVPAMIWLAVKDYIFTIRRLKGGLIRRFGREAPD